MLKGDFLRACNSRTFRPREGGFIVRLARASCLLFLGCLPLLAKAPRITGFRFTAPGQAEIQWSDAATGVTVEYAVSLADPSWEPVPGVAWPIDGASWTGLLPAQPSAIFLRLVAPGSASPPDLLVLDAEKDDAGFLTADSLIPTNPNDSTFVHYLGRAYQGEDAITKAFRLRNDGDTTLTVYAVDLADTSPSLSVGPVELIAFMPVEIAAGGSLDLQITTATAEPGLHLGRVEVVSNDPGDSLYAFHVAAAVGEPPTLLCSGDNNNWVDPDFTCVGKPDGTLCGGTTDGKSRVCNQGACRLLGDANSDGVVSWQDLRVYLADLRLGGVNPYADLDCDGLLEGDAAERRMLANLLADTHNFEAYNSRAVEGCTGRDLIRDLASHPNHGIGYVFTNGYLDLEAMAQLEPDGRLRATTPMRFQTPILACLDSLGNFDPETGQEILVTRDDFGGEEHRNGGKLTGRFLEVKTSSDFAFSRETQLIPLLRTNNDFRVRFPGQPFPAGPNPDGLPPEPPAPDRESQMWSGAVQLYHDITRMRNVFFNDGFIKSLGYPDWAERNLLFRQYRPDFDHPRPRFGKPEVGVLETSNGCDITLSTGPGIRLYPDANVMCVPIRPRFLLAQDVSISSEFDDLFSSCYDVAAPSDLFGVVGFWAISDRRGFPPDSGYTRDPNWATTVAPALNDWLSEWEAYRLAGANYTDQDLEHLANRWPYSNPDSFYNGCRTGGLHCQSSLAIDNVQMFGGAGSNPATFPYYDSSVPQEVGRGENHSVFAPSVLLDLATEVGIGETHASVLLWKTLEYITDSSRYPMEAFAADLIRAARELFRGYADLTGRAWFEEPMVQALSARGLPLFSKDFRENLTPAVQDAKGSVFTSRHPLPQRQVRGDRVEQVGVFEGVPGSAYYAFQFHAGCKLGPCDSFELGNGEFLEDGTYVPALESGFRYVFTGRDLANTWVMAPGSRFSWKVTAARCADEQEVDFFTDVAAFGFRVIHAGPDGFGVDTGKTIDGVTVLRVVDPSDHGQYRYTWNFTYLETGERVTLEGPKVFPRNLYQAPVSLELRRTDLATSQSQVIRHGTLGGSHGHPQVRDFTRAGTTGDTR